MKLPPYVAKTLVAKILVAASLALGACAPASSASLQPPPEPSAAVQVADPGDFAALPTPTAEPTPVPLPPTLESLVINGIPADILPGQVGGQYPVGEIGPGGTIGLVVQVRDEVGGSLSNVFGNSVEYRPGEPIELRFKVPERAFDETIELYLKGADGQSSEFSVMFTPGNGFLPAIDVQLPEGVYAGHPITIPVSIVDLDGDEVSTGISQVLGMGDRYTGNQYVTSQELESLELTPEGIQFSAQFPGNYRIELTATEAEGSSKRVIDVPVTWAEGENPFEIQGVAIDFWGPPEWHKLSQVRTLIDDAQAAGANYIQLAPYLNAASTSGNDITSCSALPGKPCTTPSDQQLREWIRYAHEQDMGVLLKPHLVVGSFNRDTGSYDAESWQIRPSNPTEWFENYGGFILHYAQLAQEEGVEMFAVGNELNGTHGYGPQWENLIGMVREAYEGQLTYSDVALWYNGSDLSSFWDSLDVIGVPYYYKGSAGDKDPSIEEMVAYIQGQQGRNLSATMRRSENPVIATEMGRPNFDGGNYDPWDWSNRSVDNDEQVRKLEADFVSQLALGDRFRGGFLWVLKPRAETYQLDWDPRTKPVFEAMRFWYSN